MLDSEEETNVLWSFEHWQVDPRTTADQFRFVKTLTGYRPYSWMRTTRDYFICVKRYFSVQNNIIIQLRYFSMQIKEKLVAGSSA